MPALPLHKLLAESTLFHPKWKFGIYGRYLIYIGDSNRLILKAFSCLKSFVIKELFYPRIRFFTYICVRTPRALVILFKFNYFIKWHSRAKRYSQGILVAVRPHRHLFKEIARKIHDFKIRSRPWNYQTQMIWCQFLSPRRCKLTHH